MNIDEKLAAFDRETAQMGAASWEASTFEDLVRTRTMAVARQVVVRPLLEAILKGQAPA